MWEGFFAFTNWIALAGWAVLLLLPRKPVPLSLVFYLGAGLLSACYALILGLLLGGVDPVAVPGAPPADISNYSIAGIRALFQSDGGIVLGWTHYLAFDLFTGLWIARDADAKGFSRLAQAPFLLLTFFVGPVGLLGWFVMRERRARMAARASGERMSSLRR